jgi:hypothetical protein
MSGKATRRELRVYAVQNGGTSIQQGSMAVEVISPGSRNFRRNSPAQWFHLYSPVITLPLPHR